jgi:hypothetical protein
MKNILTLLVILLFSFPFAQTQKAQPQTLQSLTATTRAEKWRQDLKYMAAELPKRHKNAFHSITRQQFNRAVAELNKAIPSLQDHEIILGFRRILALIGDGHTNIYGWESSFRGYPFRFYRFSDGYYVTRATPEYSNVLGKRLVKIGNLDVNKAYDAVITLLPKGEGEMYLWHYAPIYLSFAEVQYALRMQPSAARGSFTFEDRNRKQFSVEMNSLTGDEARAMQFLDAATKIPSYRQRRDKAFSQEYLADSKTVYFKFTGGFPSFAESFRAYGELLDFIEKNPTERLVIDLRSNGGGDSSVFEPLIQGLIRNENINQKGRLFGVIGRATYSAGMIEAAWLQQQTNAIMIGEPTGAKPNQYNEVVHDDKRIILPNSKLEVAYTVAYRKLVKGDPPALMPDVRVNLSSLDYIAGRDPVLEKILAYTK